MPRQAVPLYIPDLSQFARALARDLPDAPGHQTLLNALAKAGGYRNLSHLHAQDRGPSPQMAPDDAKAVATATRLFEDGRLSRWPARNRIQRLCLWAMWARLPGRVDITEREISAYLDEMAAFRDAAQLRRALVEFNMVTRTRDGSVYRRVEMAPPPAGLAVIAAAL